MITLIFIVRTISICILLPWYVRIRLSNFHMLLGEINTLYFWKIDKHINHFMVREGKEQSAEFNYI